MTQRPSTRTLPARAGMCVASLAALLAAIPAHASFLQGDTLAKVANVMAIVVIILVPIIGIVVFWLVHILPEKIAHKRHHPQKDAIQTLCLLSLVFGGLLWPIAWLWAYTKPVSYRLAYGTDKGDEYFVEMAEKAQAGALPPAEMKYLHDELEAIASRGAMSLELQHARTRIDAALAAATAAAAPPLAAGAPTPTAQGAA